MKYKSLLAILVLIIMATFLLWRKPNRQESKIELVLNSTNISFNTTETVVSNSSVTAQTAGLPKGIGNTVVNDRDKPEAFKQSIEDKNSPIEFYGKVIDQDNNAVSGAKVSIGIRQWYVRSIATFDVGAHFTSAETESGVDGRFEIHGKTGDGFGVGITKDGYELEPNKYGFGPTAGSYVNPVIFKMWSTNIHEKLITGEKSFEILPNGKPHVIDLTSGTIADAGDGDLKIWIQYTNQATRGQLYDWSAGIEVVNGGLLEQPHGTVMYSAPTDDYMPSFQLQQQIKGGQSGEMGDRSFYLKLNNGQKYGRMNINLFAPYGRLHPGLIRLSYAINPSGSRILR
jgi:hypothetical protein